MNETGPDVIRFTGLTVHIDELPVCHGFRTTIPPEWHLIWFVTDAFYFGPICEKVEEWTREQGFAGKWAIKTMHADSRTIYVFFELLEDAVMFRLKGGETAWVNSDEANF